jgi:oxygen-independent coproporphyrinogen-3 oxidase
LGVGPSAHSFNKFSRSWNIAHNNAYLKGITAGESVSEMETLTLENRANEYIMTSLRTIWGLDFGWFENEFPTHAGGLKKALQNKVNKGVILQKERFFILTREARILADGIASDLFV